MEKAAANRTRRGRRARREDRISKLPEELLHHILCFLDQRTAATTSVLSKPWRYLWCTRPQIDFLHGITVVPGIKKESLLSVIDRTLRGYSDRNLHLQEVTLRLPPPSSDGDTASFVTKWIRILVQSMGVNKFYLHFLTKYDIPEIKIPLPLSIFRSESLRNLSLYRCVLKSISGEPPLHLKNLQKLALRDVEITEEILDHILSNCRFVEYVSLGDCKGFKSIQPKHPASLREFRFNGRWYYRKENVSIAMGDEDIPTLRTMEIVNCLLPLDRNYQFFFSHLTSLTMTNVKLSSSDLFSCSLPCLEELKLKYCSGIKEFNLSSPSMKLLKITNTNSPFKVKVDAPSIVTFRYKGVLPQSISFSAAAAAAYSWKSYIDLSYKLNDSSSLLNDLIGLLEALSKSQISIELGETKVGWLRDQLPFMNDDADLPVVVDHVIVAEPMRAADFFNSLFLVLRPRFINMRYIKELSETHQVTEMNLKQRDMMWQLFPEGVSTQVLYWNKCKGKWRPFEAGILSKLISKKGESMDQICCPTDLERRIKLVIFDLDRASISYRKFIRNYLALCY